MNAQIAYALITHPTVAMRRVRTAPTLGTGIVMLLAGEETIREVIPFPKNQNAVDLLFNAPEAVTEKQLAELHLRIRDEEVK